MMTNTKTVRKGDVLACNDRQQLVLFIKAAVPKYGEKRSSTSLSRESRRSHVPDSNKFNESHVGDCVSRPGCGIQSSWAGLEEPGWHRRGKGGGHLLRAWTMDHIGGSVHPCH